jgi:glycosyltransferase involved in cell wall biosynthesis
MRFFVRSFSRRLCEGVDHLIVPTSEMADVLKGYGIATPSTVVPTGIRLDEFARGDAKRFRDAHGFAANAPLLLTVSRLAIEKNIDFLLEVAQALNAATLDFTFVIAGEGPDAPRLKRLASSLGLEDRVRFLGNLDRDSTLLDCYGAADVFVFASSTETQGLVLIEAMACGAPIVSTAVMGTATVLRGARSALIAEENVEAFAALVARLLSSPDERNALSAAGPLDAEKWSAGALMRKVVSMYERLAGSPHAGAEARAASTKEATQAT